MRLFVIIFFICLSVVESDGQPFLPSPVIADSISKLPLSNASVFDANGKMIGITRKNGQLPLLSSSDYPITIRYMGFHEKVIHEATSDTVFLIENLMELPELIVESNDIRMSHILAYVREYSTLTSFTDTVTLFREKMTDFMIPTQPGVRHKGWNHPRVLSSRSYYRFTDVNGLDSVSDRCSHHFSWADWIGLPVHRSIPINLIRNAIADDTVYGRYGPAEIWRRQSDRLRLDIDVLADTSARQWIPDMSSFFRDNVDFQRFKIHYDFEDIVTDEIDPLDLSAYSFTIESGNRGRGMFHFNKVYESVYVTTYAEVYIVDKELISLKEAKKWERLKISEFDIEIIEPPHAPPLQPSVLTLINRVDAIEHDNIRLALTPDQRLVSTRRPLNFGQSALKRLKGIFGIDRIKGNRKISRRWKDFKRDWQSQKDQRKKSSSK